MISGNHFYHFLYIKINSFKQILHSFLLLIITMTYSRLEGLDRSTGLSYELKELNDRSLCLKDTFIEQLWLLSLVMSSYCILNY
jgi:hypothetical protein